MVNYLDSRRIMGTTAERSSIPSPAVYGGWVELGRTTLGSTASSISVSSFADKRYYMILENLYPDSGTFQEIAQLNSDTGNNYSYRRSENGAGELTGTNQTFMGGFHGATAEGFVVHYLANYSTKEKLMISWGLGNDTGAGNAPVRREVVSKHAQASNPVSTFTSNVSVASNFNTGSEVVVLGWDPTDTHTTNFWEELADVTASGSSSNLSSGTITAKKYLWIQIYVDPASSTDLAVTFNNDTGNNYAIRVSDNGGADGTSVSRANINLDASITTPTFVNMFVINNSSKEKLCIAHSIEQSTAGAGNAPTRRESANKWVNTSSQITEIDVDSSGGNWGSSSFIKVWGSN